MDGTPMWFFFVVRVLSNAILYPHLDLHGKWNNDTPDPDGPARYEARLGRPFDKTESSTYVT